MPPAVFARTLEGQVQVGKLDSGVIGFLKTTFQNLNGILFEMRENSAINYYNTLN